MDVITSSGAPAPGPAGPGASGGLGPVGASLYSVGQDMLMMGGILVLGSFLAWLLGGKKADA